MAERPRTYTVSALPTMWPFPPGEESRQPPIDTSPLWAPCERCRWAAGSALLPPHRGCTCSGGCRCSTHQSTRRLCPECPDLVDGRPSKIYSGDRCRARSYARLNPRRRRPRPPAPPAERRYRADLQREVAESLDALAKLCSLSRSEVANRLLMLCIKPPGKPAPAGVAARLLQACLEPGPEPISRELLRAAEAALR